MPWYEWGSGGIVPCILACKGASIPNGQYAGWPKKDSCPCQKLNHGCPALSWVILAFPSRPRLGKIWPEEKFSPTSNDDPLLLILWLNKFLDSFAYNTVIQKHRLTRTHVSYFQLLYLQLGARTLSEFYPDCFNALISTLRTHIIVYDFVSKLIRNNVNLMPLDIPIKVCSKWTIYGYLIFFLIIELFLQGSLTSK
jgi:hypothetical protein